MSQTIEERVVQMKFDNKQFERGVRDTIKQIGELEDSLKFKGAEDGLDHLQKSMDDLDFRRLTEAVETIADRFTNLGVVGMEVLSKLTDKAMAFASSLLNKVAIQPITEGMNKYFDTLSSTAVMKNAGESLDVIDENLAKLMKYSDETSYSFTQMTAAASSFVNAGQSLAKSEKMIEGIANAAASAGVSTRNAQPIFNAFSKAMTKGELSLQQWYSLDASGFATQDFRKRLIEAGVAAGKLNKNFEIIGKTVGKDKKAIKVMQDSLTETLQYGWVDRNVMLKLFAGYAEDQAAYEMAQKARSFQDVWDATADAVSSSWLKTWDLVFGDLDTATEFFTNLANGIYDILMPWNELRNSYFEEMAAGGVFDSIREKFYELMEPVADISTAVSNLFGGVVMSNAKKFLEDVPQKLEGVTGALSELADYVTLNEDEVSNKKIWYLGGDKKGMLEGKQDLEGYLSYWEDFFPKMLSIKDGISSVIELLRAVGGGIGNVFKGAMQQLKPTFTAIGSAFADVGGIVTTFVNLLLGKDPVYKTAKTNKIQKFTQIILKILKPFTNLINKAAKGISNFTGKVRAWLNKSKTQKKIEDMFNRFFAFLEKIPDKIQGAFDWVTGKIKPVSDLLKSLIGDLSDPEKRQERLDNFREKWEKVKTWLADTWEKIKNFVSGVTQPISDWFNGLIGDLSDPEKRQERLEKLQEKWDAIKTWFSDTWEKIKDFLKPVTQPISDWFNGLIGDLTNPEEGTTRSEALQLKWDAIKEWFSTTWESIQTALKPVTQPISDWFNGLIGDMSTPESRAESAEKLQKKLEGFIASVKEFWDGVVLPTVQPIGQFFSDLFDSVFGTSGEEGASPEDIEAKAVNLTESFNNAFEAVKKFFATIYEKIVALFMGGGEEKSDTVAAQDVAEVVEEAKNGFPAIDFQGLWDKAKSAFLAIGAGAGGMKVLDIIKGLVSKDKTPKKSIFEKAGDMVHDVGAGLLMIAGAFGIMALGVYGLSQMADGDFEKGLIRVGIVLAVLVGTLGVITYGIMSLLSVTTGAQFAMAGKAIKDIGTGLILISGAALLCGLSIALLGILPLGVLGQGGAALVVVLAALTTVAIALNKSSGALGGGTSLSTAASLLAMALAIVLLTGPIIALGMMPREALLQGGIAAVVLLAALAGAISVLSKISPAQGANAALVIVEFMAALGAGAAVVAFFATGVIESIGAAITTMASNLEMAQSMLSGFDKQLILDALEVYGQFVLKALTMVGIDLSGIYSVSAAMLELSEDMALYTGNLKGLDFSNSSAALQAAKDVASIAESINSIQNASELSTVIAQVGAAIDLYYQHLAKIGGDEGDSSVDPAKIATMFTDLVNNMPDDQQIAQIASFATGGGNDLTSFALGLTNLGTALKDYANSVEDLKANKLRVATNALDFLGTLNTKLTANLAVVTLLGSYKTPLESFGGDIVTLGTALNNFAKKTNNLDEGKIATATNALDFLGTLQEKLPQKGGIFSWFVGHKESLGEFATDMNTLGTGLQNFATKVNDAGFGDQTDAAIAFLGKWVDMQAKLNGMTESTLRIKDIAWDLQQLNGRYFEDVQGVVDKMKGFDASGEGVDNFIQFLNRISLVQRHLVGMTEGSLRIEDLGYDLREFVSKGYMSAAQTFTNKARDISVDGMDSFLKFLKDFGELEAIAATTDSNVLDDIGNRLIVFMEALGGDLTTGFANSLGSDTTKVKSAAGKLVDAARSKVEGYEGEFYKAAKWLIVGLSQGLENYAYIAINSVQDVANSVIDTFNQKLLINSPSKVFEESGMYADQGLAIGLIKYATMVEEASEEVGNAAIDRNRAVLATVSEALANDLDSQPTITPVMDMSQIEAGSARLNGIFGDRSFRVSAGGAANAALNTEMRASNFGYTGYDDRNVLSAFASMNDRIDALSEEISHLQLVLDTGVLAGALTPKIDKRLGDIAALKGRSAFY